MGDDGHVLLAELKTLRAGRGVNSSDLEDKLGPGLRALCGVSRSDPTAAARAKVADRLGALADLLPPDLATAARAALALHPDARHHFLQERTGWLAGRLQRDVRTARRRMDEALEQIAQLAGVTVEPPADRIEDTYYIQEYAALLRLDRPAPEAHERRTVVATTDGVEELDALITLPRDSAGRGVPEVEVEVEVLYGVRMLGGRRATDSRFHFRLQLPRALRTGDRHEYGLLFRIPPEQPMRSHFVFTSNRRCDLFDLRVRFDPDCVPADVRQVWRGYPRDLDDAMAGERVVPDSIAELHLRFPDLLVGRTYGARWSGGPRAGPGR